MKKGKSIRVLLIAVIAFALIAMTAVCAFGADGTVVAGDVNSDGKVTIDDLVLFAQYLAEWKVEVNEPVFDVNCDGEVDISDIVRLAQYLANWDVSIGVPDVKPSEGLAYTQNADGKGYTVSGIGTCTDTDVVIPSTYNNLPVTSIGYFAFSGCEGLASITIPSGVTSISSLAFHYCTKLETITFKGTEEQWKVIMKGWSWDSNAGSNTSAGKYTVKFEK